MRAAPAGGGRAVPPARGAHAVAGPRRAVLAVLALALLAGACGKVGPLRPPGPPDQVTHPRQYPAR